MAHHADRANADHLNRELQFMKKSFVVILAIMAFLAIAAVPAVFA
jgi:hypothetical protein